jgi:predicted dehydrogenase
VVVVGSERMAVYNDLAEERLRIYDRGVEFEEASSATHERPLSYRYGDILSPHIQFHEPLSLEDRHFIECIRTGTRPQCDGLSGLQVVSVLEAADRSLQAGGAIRVEIENDVRRLFPRRRTPVEARL